MMKEVERQGYRTVEATNDVEAIKFVALGSIDLIVTEEELPTFDALMGGLREPPILSSVPVVIVNPDADDGARLEEAYLLTDYADITALLAFVRG